MIETAKVELMEAMIEQKLSEQAAQKVTEMKSSGKLESLETQTCGRCGGSGHYSYCQSYGTTCFKCHGSGRVYTKRGAAAHIYNEQLLSKPASELRVGMKIKEMVITMGGSIGGNRWALIQEIRQNETGTLEIITATCQHSQNPPTEIFRVAASSEEKIAARAKAIEYQNSLTKSGTVRVSGRAYRTVPSGQFEPTK